MILVAVGIGAFLFEWPHRLAVRDTLPAPDVVQPVQPPAQNTPQPSTPPQTATPKPSLFSAPAIPRAATPVPAERPAAIAPRPPSTAPVASAPVMPRPRTSPGDPLALDEERRAASIEVDKVGVMLRDYRSRMGENPVGTNAEIMKAVMGDNPKGARLGPPEGQGLNGNGELMDRWGTPYFFHQLSKTNMEIRSAGPDRMLYTEDDIVAH
jgi:hypothetical protein